MFSLLPLIALLAVLLIAWLWRLSMQAKEIATKAAQKASDQHGLQFLDETVVLSKLKIKKGRDNKLHFFRHYQFEYYDGEQVRKKSTVSLLGIDVVEIGLEAYSNPEEKVIEFKR